MKLSFLKHNGTLRDPNTQENIEFATKINEQIDVMIKYKAYSSFLVSLRARLAARSGKYKAYAAEILKKTNIYSDDTNLGLLVIKKAPAISCRRELLHLALQELDVNIEQLEGQISKLGKQQRYVVCVDTSALRLHSDVLKKTEGIIDQFYQDVKKTRSDSEINSYITATIHWIRSHLHLHKLYLEAYNKAKDIFAHASRDRLFPRTYAYENVTFVWQDMQFISSYNLRITTYLKVADIRLYDKLQHMLFKVRANKGEFRFTFLLDSFDYYQSSDLEDDEIIT